MEEAKNYEICMACWCTNNRKWDNFCWECGCEIEDED